MKQRITSVIALVLTLVILAGCSGGNGPIYKSEHFTFTEDTATFMASYSLVMLDEEMKAAGVDTSKPLSEQIKEDGVTWEDYLYTKTVENIENILLYCEAAYKDQYALSEGMSYKASELVSYISSAASDYGITADDYVRLVYGNGATLASFEICTEMMTLCEAYELDMNNKITVSHDEALKYAEENMDKILKFNALRYTTSDKAIADSLKEAGDSDAFLKVISGLSGHSLTDTNKNGIPDAIEVRDASVATDSAGEFANAEGRKIGDTTVTEKDGKYTVTMITSLPSKRQESLWNYRMLYLSSESSTNPKADLISLQDQWKDKNGGEDGFSDLCARYSDDSMAYYGGLYRGQKKDEIPEEIVTWICDPDRKNGDTTVISESSDGAYMLYFLDGDIPRWEWEAEAAVRSEKADEKMESLKGDIEKKYELKEDSLKKIVKEVANSIG